MTEDELAKEKAVLHAMRDYPLERGQMLFLGPLSVAYIKGDWRKAPWVIPGEKAPGGKMLPDLFKIEKTEWNKSPVKKPKH